MKKFYGLFVAVMFLSTAVNAVAIKGEIPAYGNASEYYAPGIINPSEGTVELTAVPTHPGAEFHTDWYFAFRIVPSQPIKGNNLLALYTASGEGGFMGFATIARLGDKVYATSTNDKSFLKPGVPVNLALSWGKAGLLVYIDGKLLLKGPFPANGALNPMPAVFRIGTESPFNVQAAKISTRQLPPADLSVNPATEFKPGTETSFLMRKGKTAEYLATDFSRKASPVLMPVWRLTNAMSPAGKNGEITLLGLNLSSAPVTYKVKIDAKTYEDKDAGSSSAEMIVPAGSDFAEQQVQLPVKAIGFYKLNTSITAPDGQTAVWKSTYIIYPANDQNVKDGKLANYMGHNLLEHPEAMNKLGIHWGRAWNDEASYFLWHNIEPQKGVFDWTVADKAVDNAAKNGVNVLGVLGYPPLWASEDPKYTKVPHALAYCPGRWKPRSVQEWENYVYQTILHFKGRVKYWEVYNEVDFHPPGIPATFSGSTQEYFELLKAVKRAAAKADPECKILISGFSTGSVCDVNMPFDLLKMGAAKYIDIFNIHSYQGLQGVDKLRQAIDAASPGMPFWQTEQMWHEVEVSKQPELTAAIHFWFLGKNFDKYFNFGYGFFNNQHSNSPEAMLQVLAVVQNNMRKCDSFAGLLPDAKIAEFDVRHTFKRTDGNYFTAIGKEDTPAELHLSGDIIRAEDMFGRELKITRNGDISMLPQVAMVFVVSKTPLKVVEAKYAPKALVGNPGFENVSGDALGSLKGLIVKGWRFNAKGGEIILDKTARSGRYALRVSAGATPVSASIETKDLTPGKYALTVWLKSGKDQPATASLSMFDLKANRFVGKKFTDVSPQQYTKYTAEFELKTRPEGVVKFYIGAEPQSSILCDDVELVNLSEKH